MRTIKLDLDTVIKYDSVSAIMKDVVINGHHVVTQTALFLKAYWLYQYEKYESAVSERLESAKEEDKRVIIDSARELLPQIDKKLILEAMKVFLTHLKRAYTMY